METVTTKSANSRGLQPRRVKGSRRLWLYIFLAGVVLVAIACLGLAHKAISIRSDLKAAIDISNQVGKKLASGEIDTAADDVRDIKTRVRSADDKAASPLWKAASHLPFIGPNFRTVAEVTLSANELLEWAVDPMVSALIKTPPSSFIHDDGQIDVEAVRTISPVLVDATRALDRSFERLSAIDTSPLILQLGDPVSDAVVKLDNLRIPLTTIASASVIAPNMLGSDEKRSYLVLIQNPAESRSTGGIPGALAVISLEKGRMKFDAQDSAAAIGPLTPSLDVDLEQEKIFTARIGREFQNVNLTPDFPTVGSTSKEMWEKTHAGSVIDGVIALDPIVLSKLLASTGPISFPENTETTALRNLGIPTQLSSKNVAEALLSTVYEKISDPTQQDAYFAHVAELTFAALSSGDTPPERLASAFKDSLDDDRIRVWSAHSEEQAIIAKNVVGGAMNGEDVPGPVFGVYFNDGTGAKMDYYVKRNVQLIETCTLADYGRYTVRVTVTNNAPVDAASSLPAYVTGGGVFGVKPGLIRTNYVMYGPAKSFMESARVNGEPVPVGSGKHGQRPVGIVTQELAPGETAIIEVDFTRVVQDAEPRLSVTPTVQPLSKVVLPKIREESCR